MNDEVFNSYVDKRKIEIYKEERLVLAAYKMGGGYTIPSLGFLVLLDEESEKKMILLNQRNGYKHYDYEQYLIDLEVFDGIIKLEKIKSHEKIIDKYLFYIHYDSYRNKSSSDVLNRNVFENDNSSIYEIKVWHQPRGLVDYIFTIKENKLVNIQSAFTGKRGDEIIDTFHDHRGKITKQEF